MKSRIGLVTVMVLASAGAPRSDAQQAPGGQPRPSDPRDEAVRLEGGRICRRRRLAPR